MATKPIPVPNSISVPFWEAINSRELTVQRCQNCETYFHPPVGVCPDCLSTDLRFDKVSGKGKLHSFSITDDARQPAFEAILPYTIAIVELAEQPGLFMLSNIPSARPENLRIEAPVELEFEELDPKHLIPQFHLVK